MQVSGHGFKLPAPILSAAMEESRALRGLLLAYVQALLAQTTSTVLANGHAKLEERLARWLLMVHDRTDGMMMSLTHEFLAVMLGVRRRSDGRVASAGRQRSDPVHPKANRHFSTGAD